MVALSPGGRRLRNTPILFLAASYKRPPGGLGCQSVRLLPIPALFVANILCEVLKAHKSQLGRYYNVSIIVLMEIILFGIALVVFVVALITMLLGR
jgi:hypothetical protein